MIPTVLSIATFIIFTHAVDKQYVATFGTTNGIQGTVTVDTRTVSVDLDLSAEPVLPGTFATCIDGGLKWHIHELWTHADTTDKLGSTLCNGSYTGGHYDPWNACGSASGNVYCKKATSTEATKCIDVADYSPNFPSEPFSAEIGDWSSKYGKLTPDGDNKIMATFDSFYEIQPAQLAGLSVVFHCGNAGTRAFCAPFEESPTEITDTIIDQEATKTVSASFDALSTDSLIILYPNGNVSIKLDGTNIEFTEDQFGCGEFEYGIFEAVSGNALATSVLGDDCSVVVGAQYDPTNQCLPWVSSTYCVDGVLCTDTAYSYACDYASDRYSCAPGDLSGKFGTYSAVGTSVFTVEETEDTLIPPTDGLIGKIVAITCPKTDSTKKFLACAPIVEYVEDSGDSDDKVAQISFGIAFVVSFVSLLY